MHQPTAIKNGTGHDHSINQLGPLDVDFLKNHTANAQADEMCLLDVEVINHSQDVFRNDVKIVRWKLGQDVFTQSVVSQIEKEQTIMWRKRLDLKLPCTNGPPCTVDEYHPRSIGIVAHYLVVQQCVGISGDRHVSKFAHSSFCLSARWNHMLSQNASSLVLHFRPLSEGPHAFTRLARGRNQIEHGLRIILG